MIYRTDYHIHTSYSDGRGAPADYISLALKEGLSEIGFSDHLTLTAEQQQWSILPERIGEYVEEVLALGERIDALKIRVGLEVDWIPGRERQIEDIVSRYPFDYIIGSVHYLGAESVDLGPSYYLGKDPEKLYRTYFNEIIRAAQSGLFDMMAHIDLIRIYGFGLPGSAGDLYSELASGLSRTGVAIEVNTNGRNKPVGEFYPAPSQLSHFASAGVPVCVNSDAHRPEGVGQYFDEAYSLLIRSGYRVMSSFERRRRTEVSLGL